MSKESLEVAARPCTIQSVGDVSTTMRQTANRLDRPRRIIHLILFFTFSVFVVGNPVPQLGVRSRQTWTGLRAHDFEWFGCRPIIFIYAKETIAPGNMGFWVGPQLSDALKGFFGASNVATEGVDYLGLPATNYWVGGGPPYGIGQMQLLLANATLLCPDSLVVVAGYSQGAAITHRAIEFLPQEIRDRITAVVTFGDTQTKQDGGRIVGYPLNQTLIICNIGDIICTGTLWVFPIHLDYTRRVPEAARFLIRKLLEAGAQPISQNATAGLRWPRPWTARPYQGAGQWPNTTAGRPIQQLQPPRPVSSPTQTSDLETTVFTSSIQSASARS